MGLWEKLISRPSFVGLIFLKRSEIEIHFDFNLSIGLALCPSVNLVG